MFNAHLHSVRVVAAVGMALGKKLISRPFLSLSPNKTWEGFVGGFFSTMVGVVASSFIRNTENMMIQLGDGL